MAGPRLSKRPVVQGSCVFWGEKNAADRNVGFALCAADGDFVEADGIGIRTEPDSVFRTFDEFQAINPVVKAPSLVTDDGVVLIDSGLILEYAERLAPSQSLMPAGTREQVEALRLIGLALAAAKRRSRSSMRNGCGRPEKQHQPWLDRVTTSCRAPMARWKEAAPKTGSAAAMPNAGRYHRGGGLALYPKRRFPKSRRRRIIPALPPIPRERKDCRPLSRRDF